MKKTKEYIQESLKQLNESLLLNKEKQIINDKIKNISNILNDLDSYLNTKFYDYIFNLSKFIYRVYENFLSRFKSNKIFNDNIDIINNNDLNLFTDFMIFLSSYDFTSEETKYQFMWKDSFKHSSFEEIKYHYNGLKMIKNHSSIGIELNLSDNNILDNNNTIDNLIINIDNIDNYCIKSLLDHICISKRCLDNCEYNNFLRFDLFDEYLFIKKKWNEFIDYLTEIFCLPAIISVFECIIGEAKFIKFYNFLTKNEIKSILNKVKFFNYESDFVGLTKKKTFFIYIPAYIKIKSDGNLTKLIYLTTIVIALFHEILGHLNIRYQIYLYEENKDIKSPLPEQPSDYGKNRQKEAGEFIEEQLFGFYNNKMNIKEMLFVLDAINYKNSTNHKKFRNIFDNLDKTNMTKLNISSELKNILSLYDINIDELDYNSLEKLDIEKNKSGNKYHFSNYHSLKYKK